ncbi:Uncharacterised protein [Chlamydia abortus]|nr:Uncharacterised protein [Chlamydia abortus]
MIFSFLAIFLVLQWTFLNFPPFSVFLAIFYVLKCVFLFRDFQFSRHIPGPSVCIVIFHVCSDFVIFQVVKWMFLIFHESSVFLPYSTSYSGHF